MWEGIADAQAVFTVENLNIALELVNWVPDLGPPTGVPVSMPANERSTKLSTKSSVER